MNSLKRYIYAGLLVLPLLLAGCTIKEDRSDCPPTTNRNGNGNGEENGNGNGGNGNENGNGGGTTSLKIYFDYDPAADRQDEQLVEKIDIFAFDEQGFFQAEWPDNDPHLSPITISIPTSSLPSGNYRFIVWAGTRDGYSVSPAVLTAGTTTFDEMELAILSHGNVLEYKPLFQDDLMVAISGQTGEQRIDLLLEPTYNIVNLAMERVPDPSDIHDMVITETWNGKYKFDLSRSFDGNMRYTPFLSAYSAANAELLSSFRISRLLATDRADLRDLYVDLYDMVTQVRFSSMDLILLLQDRTTHLVDYDACIYNQTIDFAVP